MCSNTPMVWVMQEALPIVSVSSGFRYLPVIMFGVVLYSPQREASETCQFIRKGIDCIGLGVEIPEEALQEVGQADQRMW